MKALTLAAAGVLLLAGHALAQPGGGRYDRPARGCATIKGCLACAAPGVCDECEQGRAWSPDTSTCVCDKFKGLAPRPKDGACACTVPGFTPVRAGRHELLCVPNSACLAAPGSKCAPKDGADCDKADPRKCAACQGDLVLVDGECQTPCWETIKGCESCNLEDNTCAKCERHGFVPDVCLGACRPGKCDEVFKGCKACLGKYVPNKCIKCDDGYMMTHQGCMPKDCKTLHKGCAACAKHDRFRCAQCKTGWYWSKHERACMPKDCKAADDKCARCSHHDRLECRACKKGYRLDCEGKCVERKRHH